MYLRTCFLELFLELKENQDKFAHQTFCQCYDFFNSEKKLSAKAIPQISK